MNNNLRIKKGELLKQIKLNKEKHIEEYNQAVVAFKKEALKQLKALTKKINKGDINDIRLELVKPINVESKYDEYIGMFEWDMNEDILLNADDYKTYILDKDGSILHASFANNTYL